MHKTRKETSSPSIIIGCMTWGKWGKTLNTSALSELIKKCVDQDLTHFDHADIYGDYTTEEAFGLAFAKNNISRDKIQLISKCGIQLAGGSRPNRVKHYELSKKYIIRSAETSLIKLKTDYLDTLLIHRPSPLMQVEEIAEAVFQLKKSGKINHFGVSNFTPSQFELLNAYVNIETNQFECSLTQPQALFDGTLDQCQQRQINAQAWSPLGGYFKSKNDQTQRLQAVVKTLSEQYQVSENTLLIAWLVKHPANISPVIGTTQIERIIEAKEALNVNMELEDWFLLLEASQGHEVP